MFIFGVPALVLILLAILFPRAMRMLFMVAMLFVLFTGLYFYRGYERWAAKQPWEARQVVRLPPPGFPPINPDTATPADLDRMIDNAR